MKKVGFASGEVSLLRRVLVGFQGEAMTMAAWSKADVKTAHRILEKLTRAEQPSDPAANAPAIEDALITYSGGKVAALALPNWQRYARQGAAAGATVADAQTIGQWMSRQGWLSMGSQTLQSVLNNWSSWLGKARATEAGAVRPQAGLNGHAQIQATSSAGNGTTTRAGSSASRPAPGLGQRPKVKAL